MTLGEQIKHEREKRNLSQEELAFQLGVSRQAVSKWENGSSLPQGINKEMLTKILNIEIAENTVTKNRKMALRELLGWIIAIILAIIFLVVWIHNKNSDTIKVPNIKSITFYDCNQDVVMEEALWHNSAQIESILIQWEGGTPDNIKMFATPSGTETMSETELLLTKVVLDGDTVELLDADTLKDKFMTHVYFQLEFGENIVISDMYNIFYDENYTQ
ncbi:MAG: helix-turn-helix transcriptional regulator [Lachnospiraceae bacterium]|nr:helix-turn-helix transcriptional regulator [Lachnospiraceae bacterium]